MLLQMYSKRDIETQPIKGGSVKEIGQNPEEDSLNESITAGNFLTMVFTPKL